MFSRLAGGAASTAGGKDLKKNVDATPSSHSTVEKRDEGVASTFDFQTFDL
jgi:hypothetical protein